MNWSTLTDSVSAAYGAVVSAFGALAARVGIRDTKGFALAVVLLVVIVVLLVVIAFMPSERKIVHKRVRRIRRRVAAPARQTSSSNETQGAEAAAEVSSTSIKLFQALDPRARVALWSIAWVALVVAAFVIAYQSTGTSAYCGQSCHADDAHVALALRHPHAQCIQCHETNAVLGMVSRFRMAFVELGGTHQVTSQPVDAQRCLKCHDSVVKKTLLVDDGLKVAHLQIIEGGRTCEDCHADVGHRKGNSFTGGVGSCYACHDGKTASRACDMCHASGSPIATADAKRKSSSTFEYPAIRVANRRCELCHGAENNCRACHNGLVLPHPKEFVRGGHARVAAFGGKEKCYKCHSVLWCGDGRCHHPFAAHDEQRWRKEHQTGTSETCGSCHISWDGRQSFCKLCH